MDIVDICSDNTRQPRRTVITPIGDDVKLSSSTFLGIPLELRLIIYQMFLEEHRRVHNRRQPSSGHFRLLLTCRRVYSEASDLFRQYVSLGDERQIESFVSSASDHHASGVKWADVANDGRVDNMKEKHRDRDPYLVPVSGLHFALSKMRHLRHLRVFEYEGPPFLSVYKMLSRTNWSLQFERAMYPSGCPLQLVSYELFVSPESRVQSLEVIPPTSLQTLRLSGSCQLHGTLQTPNLRHLSLCGITGSYFDQRRLDQCFVGYQLHTFIYGMDHRLGFEIRNHHLQSLVSGPGSGHMRKLVLIGCSRLSSEVITECLSQLPALEYFALSLVTVDEMRSNFILALPSTLSTLKLSVTNAWYSIPLVEEEKTICNTLETTVLTRDPKPVALCVHFRPSVFTEDERADRWRKIAHDRHLNLQLGPWEEKEDI